MQTLGETWIDAEDKAYPSGGFSAGRTGRVRIGRNEHAPNALSNELEGKLRKVRLSIPDTFFSIPARLHYKCKAIRGFVSVPHDSEEYVFTPEAGQGGPCEIPNCQCAGRPVDASKAGAA